MSDPYYMYRVNNGLCNNTSDYVFKSSREMVGISIMMDINNPEVNPLQFENCYFDATHKHVQGFKSLGIMDIPSCNEKNTAPGQYGN